MAAPAVHFQPRPTFCGHFSQSPQARDQASTPRVQSPLSPSQPQGLAFRSSATPALATARFCGLPVLVIDADPAGSFAQSYGRRRGEIGVLGLSPALPPGIFAIKMPAGSGGPFGWTRC